MKGFTPTAAALTLLCSLSCSFIGPRGPASEEPGHATAVTQADEPLGPSAVEWVEARFHRYQPALSDREIRRVAEMIVHQSVELDMRWELVLAVIHTESGFHNFAVSHVGALGLMQIMPRTGETLARQMGIQWRGPETLFDPLINVRMGIRYLSTLYGRYKSWDRALASYNWGPARIDWKLRNGHAMPVGYAHKVLAQVQSPLTP